MSVDASYPVVGQQPYQPQPQFQPQPQPQPQTMVVNTNAAGNSPPANFIVVQQQPERTLPFVGQVVFACFNFWCFCPLFGLIAFILALVGMNDNGPGAKGLYNAAKGLNIAAIVLGLVGWIVGLVVYFVVLLPAVRNAQTRCYNFYTDSYYYC